MVHSISTAGGRLMMAAVLASATIVVAGPREAKGQVDPTDRVKHSVSQKEAPPKTDETGDSLSEQVQRLREKVAKLEAAVSRKQGNRPMKPPGGGGMGMGSMGDGKPGGGMAKAGGGTPMKDDDSDEMAAMGGGMAKAGGGKPMKDDDSDEMAAMGGGMGMMDEMGMGSMGGKSGGGMGKAGAGKPRMNDDSMEMGMMGMGAMGKAKSMAGMAVPSALPGFPGASHLYHVGATGFFMNHGKHITLTAAQQTALNRIKQKALLAGATARRKIDEAEQELWALTGADEPRAEAIEAKAKAIEATRSAQRLAFIRSVGEAAKVLTDEQRAALVGAAADAPDEPAPAAKP